VVHELHERSPDESPYIAAREQEVDDRHEGQEADEGYDDDDLGREAAPSPAGDPVVPDGRKKLLAMRVRYKLNIYTHTHNYWLHIEYADTRLTV